MENGLVNSESKIEKMGATSNTNTARLVVLQERKKQIEETLSKRNQELRQLCIQEAELTGITPPEMPLEAGETLPQIRRRIVTAFQLNENLLESANSDELIAHLELEIQLHTNLAEAALGLANEHNMSKTLKRQHRTEYQKHKTECIALREKLDLLLKEKAAAEQVKQRKKPRVPELQDDNISIVTNETIKLENRHSHLSTKRSLNMPSPTDTYPDTRYSAGISRNSFRNSDSNFYHYLKPEEVLASGFYRLSLNGYREYMERNETVNPQQYGYQTQGLPYNYPHTSNTQSMHLPQHHYSQQLMSQHSPQLSQHSPHLSQCSLHLSQHSPLSQYSPVSQHSPQASHSPQLSQSPISQHSVLVQRSSQSYSNYPSRTSHDYGIKYGMQMHTSATNSLPQKSYYPSHTIHSEPGYNRYTVDGGFRNPHQIQPHQQYEHNGMSAGLGGCWKQSENGEMFWCYSNTIDSTWQRDRRFGSLDRRKNKRLHKRISPVEDRSATISSLPSHNDQVKTAFVKPSQINSKRAQDHRQLVRTQSLGSVGQTIDSVYPSDDTSSCESDNRSLKENNKAPRKQKEKEWLETSLDGPISPTHSIASRSQSTVPQILAPEEKYIIHSPPPPPPPQITEIPPPLTPKPVLEIPAESNPTSRVPEQLNIELLNNNIPKNCTVVQAGVCKPYHEETKPFEMSDFYKYSTKFKKSPIKQETKSPDIGHKGGNVQRNLNENFEDLGPQSPYQNQQIRMQQYIHSNNSTISRDNSGNLNTSLDLSQIAVSEHFSAEMNAWYNNQDQHLDNNNANSTKTRSSATLV